MTAALKDMQLVLLGCGQMGGALLRGLIAADLISPARVHCIDADPTRAAQLAHDTGAQLSSYALLAQLTGPRLLLAATKPGYIRAALEAAQPTADDIVVSVAAGVTLAALADAAPGAAVALDAQHARDGGRGDHGRHGVRPRRAGRRHAAL